METFVRSVRLHCLDSLWKRRRESDQCAHPPSHVRGRLDSPRGSDSCECGSRSKNRQHEFQYRLFVLC